MLFHGDCIEKMCLLEDKSIDMVFCDLPYGTTACAWDTIIPLHDLWAQYKRLVKDDGAIVLTASQPFTSKLVLSNISMFRHEWIWEKAVGSNFATLKYGPMKEHESVLVFSKNTPKYYPIMQERKGTGESRLNNPYLSNSQGGLDIFDNIKRNRAGKVYGKLRNPSSVQYFNNRESCRGLHPTQKPVALCEYFIKTFSKEGDIVLDNCMGSGTTGVAAKNTGRNFIGIELDEKYFNIAKERLAQ